MLACHTYCVTRLPFLIWQSPETRDILLIITPYLTTYVCRGRDLYIQYSTCEANALTD